MIEFTYFFDVPKDFTGICKIIKTGNIYCMKDRKPHNKNGPALIGANGDKFWYINDICHRENGPAKKYASGGKGWYYKGKYYGKDNDFTVKTWKEKVKYLKREEELEIFK